MKGGFVGYSYTTYPIFDFMDKAGMACPFQGKKQSQDFEISFIEDLLKERCDPNLVRTHTWSDTYDSYSLKGDAPSDFDIRSERESILHRAIKASAVTIVKLLLDRGVDPNKESCIYVDKSNKSVRKHE